SYLTSSTPVPPSQITRIQRYSLRDGLLWYESTRLVVPKPLRLVLLREHHDSVITGHPSWNITYANLALHYFWPRMFGNMCSLVMHANTNTPPFGLLQPLQVPERPWSSISMDFITNLPLTTKGHDMITVFVDRFTKMVHLAPGKGSYA